MKKIQRLAAWAAMILIACFVTTGCNTMHGIGEDVEEGGEAIQDAAE